MPIFPLLLRLAANMEFIARREERVIRSNMVFEKDKWCILYTLSASCLLIPLCDWDENTRRIVGFQCCMGDTLGISGTPLKSSGLGDGKDCGISVLCGGHTRNPRTPLESSGLGDGKDCGITVLCGGHWESLGIQWESPGRLLSPWD